MIAFVLLAVLSRFLFRAAVPPDTAIAEGFTINRDPYLSIVIVDTIQGKRGLFDNILSLDAHCFTYPPVIECVPLPGPEMRVNL
jgi:hypothetical protein